MIICVNVLIFDKNLAGKSNWLTFNKQNPYFSTPKIFLIFARKNANTNPLFTASFSRIFSLFYNGICIALYFAIPSYCKKGKWCYLGRALY